MPRNKRESFIYSVIMCFTMVLWMSMYNVTLHMGHLSLETIREGWIGFPFAFVYAFLFDWFIAPGRHPVLLKHCPHLDLQRCKKEMQRLNSLEDTINKEQLLFGINQGAIFSDIRTDHAKRISELDLDGYAIGGLAVGETHEQMYQIIEETVPYLPKNKPTYLMGVGTPANILEGVARGIDFFDCVYPSRNGRHGHVYTNEGKLNLFNQKYEKDMRPIEEGCQCPACRHYSRAYIRHLLKAKEMLGMRLCVLHNLYFYNTMMEEIRDALDAGNFASYKEEKLYRMGQSSIKNV